MDRQRRERKGGGDGKGRGVWVTSWNHESFTNNETLKAEGGESPDMALVTKSDTHFARPHQNPHGVVRTQVYNTYIYTFLS